VITGSEGAIGKKENETCNHPALRTHPVRFFCLIGQKTKGNRILQKIFLNNMDVAAKE
jgi:hypothetical protein